MSVHWEQPIRCLPLSLSVNNIGFVQCEKALIDKTCCNQHGIPRNVNDYFTSLCRRWRKAENRTYQITRNSRSPARTWASRCCRRWAGRRERVWDQRGRESRLLSTSKSVGWKEGEGVIPKGPEGLLSSMECICMPVKRLGTESSNSSERLNGVRVNM